ncbi:MAG: hypothetical protein QM572_02605, partial [Nocardioides sp.]
MHATASRLVVAASLVGVCVARLWHVAAPLSSDEAGFLMVARQWHPGSSLYGDYWVDRPPGLITLYRVADLAGGTVALRVVGLVAVLVAVALAARLGRVLAGPTGTAV